MWAMTMFNIIQGEPSPLLRDHYSVELERLIMKMLNKDPKLRPTARAILKEKIIQKTIMKTFGAEDDALEMTGK